MKHASFFTGLGVVDYASELIGWENIFQVEKDVWLTKRLNNVFKNTDKYEDIKTFDGTKYRDTIDIISGGDPCQPSSVAGNRKGKDDDRYLWPEMFRCIKEIRPGWVFNENVTGTISNGILDQKIIDLESEGYACWPPLVISASVVGAPHQRYRCFLIAYSVCQRNEIPNSGEFTTKQLSSSHSKKNAPNTNKFNVDLSGLYSGKTTQYEASKILRDYESRWTNSFGKWNWGTNWNDIASEFCRMDDGITKRLVDKGHRLKALGNGIVLPQILEMLYCIDYLHKQKI